MKKLTAVLVFAVALSGAIHAQTKVVDRVISLDKNQRVVLDLRFGDEMRVEAWNRSELSFEAVVEINSGKLNEAFVLDIEEGSSVVRLETDFDRELSKKGRRIDCPQSTYGSYWNTNDESFICSDIYYTILVPKDTDLKIETISADVELKGLEGPLDVKSISGFVDLTWNENHGADLYLKTVTGDAFTDLETLAQNKDRHYQNVGLKINTTVAGGGNRIKLETISGDIFLRKTK